jgi:hypothetical protein
MNPFPLGPISLGLDTFGDVTLGPDGRPKRMDEVLRDVVREAVLADELGIDFMGLGEHHREDFAISAPEVVLAAIAGATKRIRLGTAVTVLSTDDPVRVFQRFSTLNAVSGGRAEAILGRGSFTEVYELFGFDMKEYDLLFEERLDLFARLLREERVTWSGETRAAPGRGRGCRPLGPRAPTWVGVGGSPESVIRVVRHDLRDARHHRRGPPPLQRPSWTLPSRLPAARPRGPPHRHPLARLSWPNRRGARDEAVWPTTQAMFGKIGPRAGLAARHQGAVTWRGGARRDVRGLARDGGAQDRAAVQGLGVAALDLKYSNGPMPHDQLMDGIRLYGERCSHECATPWPWRPRPERRRA